MSHRRKKSNRSPRRYSSPLSKRRRVDYRSDSSSPFSTSSTSKRKSSNEEVQIPPEYPTFNYEEKCPIFTNIVDGDPDTSFDGLELTDLQHELETMLAECAMNSRRLKGDLRFLTEGNYLKENLKKRPMPKYKLRKPDEEQVSQKPAEGEGICGLPEEDEEDDINLFPPPCVSQRFWTWCKEEFDSRIDADYLIQFKTFFMDANNGEEMQKYYYNAPWKYRVKTPSTKANRQTSNGTASRSSKRVSIASDVELCGSRSSGRRTSAGKIRARRSSEKDSSNNNKIMPMIDSMVMSACRELKDSKSAPDTPVTHRRGRSRMSIEETKERRSSISVKNEPIEIEVEEELSNSTFENNRFSPRLNSPKTKKEKEEDELELPKYTNGFSITPDSFVNGNYSNGCVNGKLNGDFSPKSCKRGRNGYVNGMKKPPTEELDQYSDIEDFDAKAIGEKLVAKLIAGGVLHESSARIFEQLSNEDTSAACSSTTKLEIDEEGRDEAENPEMDELSEELKRCQLELPEKQARLNEVLENTWKQLKMHYVFWHTYDQLRAADYDLFKLGVNMYRDLPRRLPGIVEKPHLKEAMKRRNKMARFHYGNTYRRHPKYRWKLRTPSSSSSRKRISTSP